MAFTVTGAAHYAVVNPDTIAAQVQSRALFGLTAIRYGATPLKGGRMERSNLHDYRRMRMNDVPAIESHMKSAEALDGFDEAAFSTNCHQGCGNGRSPCGGSPRL